MTDWRVKYPGESEMTDNFQNIKPMAMDLLMKLNPLQIKFEQPEI
jgi:hypothetical protein